MHISCVCMCVHSCVRGDSVVHSGISRTNPSHLAFQTLAGFPGQTHPVFTFYIDSELSIIGAFSYFLSVVTRVD